MGTLKVTLEDENGKALVQVLEEIGAPLNRGMARAVGPRFPWAATIDPYGDTTFNHLQADLLRKEWAVLIAQAEDEKTREALQRVDALLQRCIAERLYIKFYGD